MIRVIHVGDSERKAVSYLSAKWFYKTLKKGLDQWFSKFVFTFRPYKPKHCQLLYKRNKKHMQKFHTTCIWFQVSFEELSQGKIKTLQKNNFTKEKFKEIA